MADQLGRQQAAQELASAQQAVAQAKALLASKEAQALKRGKETREALKQIERSLNERADRPSVVPGAGAPSGN